eukprot:COSAG02_NODE_17638_length_989_cov_36201.707865_1_plen_258_part_10
MGGAAGGQKPRAVVSYCVKQNHFKDLVCNLLESQGFEAWSGADVVGGGNRIPQWIQMADDAATKVIVFILSADFQDSIACNKEFNYVMCSARLEPLAVPILFEDFKMLPEYTFNLVDCNYITVTPATQPGQRRQISGEDLMVMEPYPDTAWQDNFLFAALAKCSDGLDATEVSQRLDKKNEQLDADVAQMTGKSGIRHLIAKQIGVEDHDIVIVGVIGGTSFFNSNSQRVCEAIGKQLATVKIIDDSEAKITDDSGAT